MNPFVEKLNLDHIEPMQGDMSRRRYYSARKDGQESLVMVYPDALPEDKVELRSFVAVGEWLAAQGLRVPKVYDFDLDHASAHIEYLGAQALGDLRRGGADMDSYYEAVCDVLARIASAPLPEFIPPFAESKVNSRLIQFVDYYVPCVRGKATTPHQREGFLNAWDALEKSLPPAPQTMQLMDAHLENFIWQAHEEGVKRCAIIDHQDASAGPMPYDLVNLLEDARVDVDPDLKTKLIVRFCAGMSAEEREIFECWYAAMACHFHARVIGLFIMQAVENNRDDYLIHVPRMERYLRGHLQNPILKPMVDWFRAEGLDFESGNAFDGDRVRVKFNQIEIKE